MSEPPTPKRLVSFLGTGEYTPTRYITHDGREAPEGRFLACALCDLYELGEVWILATDTAWETHGEALGEALAGRGLEWRRRRLAPGAEPADFWQHFEVLREALEAPEGVEILLDITHAFRAQPVFAVSALSYQRAIAPSSPDCRIVYGAFNPKEPGRSPIWDVTAAVSLMDWTHGLTLLLETGRSGAVVAAIKRTGGLLQRRWFEGGRQGQQPNLVPLSNALERFCDDLATVRTRDLITGAGGRPGSAAHLLETIERCRGDVVAALPPLGAVLDRIADMAKPLPAASLEPDGRTALSALARCYLSLGRYLEAATTLREARINYFCESPEGVSPGPSFDRDERKRAEGRWWRSDPEQSLFTDVRNDLNHGGYCLHPRPAGKLIEHLERLASAEAPALGGTSDPEPPERDVFLNLSNHPSSSWAAPQRRAAEALAPEVVDLPFPEVDPEADLEALHALADATVREAPAAAAVAMVMGEHTLVPLLVRGLREKGVRCVSATTRRSSEDLPDGGRRVHFHFVRFRDYPELG